MPPVATKAPFFGFAVTYTGIPSGTFEAPLNSSVELDGYRRVYVK
nr:MAG TPA: hypothetical protein [Caudoviricetes sp.]